MEGSAKIAVYVYDSLSDDSDLALAKLGCGQQLSYSGIRNGGWGGYADGCAIIPQIGESPARLIGREDITISDYTQ